MVMPTHFRHFYEFGPFRLDPEKHRLLRGGEPIHLSPKSLEALVILVENAGRLLERETLIQAVWADTFVEDANLTVAISHLRKALGQHTETAEYIETIPRVGYRFVAKVREAYDETKPLIIEKRTQSRTVIEEELLPDYRGETVPAVVVGPSPSLDAHVRSSRNRRYAVATTSTLLLLTLGAFLYFRPGNNRSSAVGNLARVQIRSLAILPPQPLSSEADNAALSLGIADALITRMGGIQKLVVRPTSAIARYVDTNQDRSNAGQALLVDAVLDGTLQRNQGRIRLRLRLLNTANGDQLWARAFDEADGDVFKLQDAICQQLGDALYSNLSPNERVALARHQTTSSEAYANYLQGNYFWSKRGNEAAKSIKYFREAIQLDPNYAQAYVTLAAVDSTGGAVAESETLIYKALQLDDQLAEAHATLAFIRMFQHWDWTTAEKELDRALELDPNSSVAHHWKGVYLSIRGRLDEAKAEMHRALDLNPLSLIILADLGQLHYFAHDYDQAFDYCHRVLTMDPDFWVAHEYLLDIYRAKGMNDEALNELIKLDFQSASPETLQRLRDMYARGGIRALFQERLNAFLASGDDTSAIVIAKYYSRLGDNEHAVYWLDRAVSAKGIFWDAYIAVDPLYDPLHSDARFKAVVHRINL